MTRLSFTVLLLLATHFNCDALSFEKYLKANGVEINEGFIKDNVRFYLNRRSGKEGLFWHDGSIFSQKGKEYTGLKLKFNTIDNTINILHDEKFYRIAPQSMTGFSIIENGKKRLFRKGFFENRVHKINADFFGPSKEVHKYILKFKSIDNFNFQKFQVDKKEGKGGKIKLTFDSPSDFSSRNFQAYLEKNENINRVKVNMKETGLEPGVFYEVLAEGDNGYLLKLFSKKSIESNSVSVIQHSYSVTFDKFKYYVAKPDKKIRQVVFLKSSVNQAHQFLGIKRTKKIGTIRGEERLTKYMKTIL